MTSRLRQWLARAERNFLLGPPPVRARRRPEIAEPGGRARISSGRLGAATVCAVVLPAATALALLPARANHSQTTAVALVLPVVAVALLGAFGPAMIAAAVAALTYDVIHTKPYGRLVIDDPDDIATTVVLFAVAVSVGGLCSRIIRLRARDAGRGLELQHLTQFTQTATSSAAADELSDEACRHLTAVLDLRHCRWRADYHGQAAPTLIDDGRVVDADRTDQALLPAELELPAIVGGRELGRFILSSRGDGPVSTEQRAVAASIAALFAFALDDRS